MPADSPSPAPEFRRWTCPRCGKTYRLKPGTFVPACCRRCKTAAQPTTSPASPWSIPPDPPQLEKDPPADRTPPLKSRASAPAAFYLLASVCVLPGLLLWASGMFPISYFGILLAGYGVTLVAATRWRQRKRTVWIAGGALTLVAALWYGARDTYTDSRLVGDIVRTETHRRWTGRPLHAHLFRHRPFASMGGPVSASGKQHGHWTGRIEVDGKELPVDLWYWFGDVVTEGEWHLRNR